ncbi:MAG: Gfo/Idh/MocA family oxidoreductase [bacterium]|nr:Gfo/Idh/MocA family oxidoreductase [bacterium]
MQLALIGCGRRLRQDVLPTLAELGGPRVAALVDPDTAEARRVLELARSLRVRTVDRPLVLADDRLLSTDSIDAVVIASPHASHYEQAGRWLRRGKPVFVEKPLACRPDEGTALEEASRGVGLAVCDPRRFRPDLLELHRLVQSGAAGQLRSVRYVDFVRRSSDFAESWRNDPRLAGGGVLLDLGCHTLSALLRICGPSTSRPEIEQVRLHRGSYRVETEARVRLRLAAAVKAEVVVGLAEGASPSHEELTLLGDAGTIRLRRQRGRESCSLLEIDSNGKSSSFAMASGTRFDGESLRRFLRSPSDASKAWLREHIEILHLISEVYREAGPDSPQRPQTTTAIGMVDCPA